MVVLFVLIYPPCVALVVLWGLAHVRWWAPLAVAGAAVVMAFAIARHEYHEHQGWCARGRWALEILVWQPTFLFGAACMVPAYLIMSLPAEWRLWRTGSRYRR